MSGKGGGELGHMTCQWTQNDRCRIVTFEATACRTVTHSCYSHPHVPAAAEESFHCVPGPVCWLQKKSITSCILSMLLSSSERGHNSTWLCVCEGGYPDRCVDITTSCNDNSSKLEVATGTGTHMRLWHAYVQPSLVLALMSTSMGI